MSLLNYLQLQEIDSDMDNSSDDRCQNDEISLNEPIDENSLESFWDKVDQDIQNDPEWFSFADE